MHGWRHKKCPYVKKKLLLTLRHVEMREKATYIVKLLHKFSISAYKNYQRMKCPFYHGDKLSINQCVLTFTYTFQPWKMHPVRVWNIFPAIKSLGGSLTSEKNWNLKWNDEEWDFQRVHFHSIERRRGQHSHILCSIIDKMEKQFSWVQLCVIKWWE